MTILALALMTGCDLETVQSAAVAVGCKSGAWCALPYPVAGVVLAVLLSRK